MEAHWSATWTFLAVPGPWMYAPRHHASLRSWDGCEGTLIVDREERKEGSIRRRGGRHVSSVQSGTTWPSPTSASVSIATLCAIGAPTSSSTIADPGPTTPAARFASSLPAKASPSPPAPTASSRPAREEPRWSSFPSASPDSSGAPSRRTRCGLGLRLS